MSIYDRYNDRDVHAYLMYGQDGLQDIAVGLVLLLAGLLLHTDNAAVAGILAVLVYPFLLMGKRFVTMPRVAQAELPPARVMQQHTVLALVFGLSFLLLVFLVFGLTVTGLVDLTGRFWPTLGSVLAILGSVLAILMAGLAALLAWRANNRRLPLYFLLIMATFLLLSRSSVPLPAMMIVLGVLISLIGLYMLGRFLLTHPRLA